MSARHSELPASPDRYQLLQLTHGMDRLRGSEKVREYGHKHLGETRDRCDAPQQSKKNTNKEVTRGRRDRHRKPFIYHNRSS